jgi:hypothetical protein
VVDEIQSHSKCVIEDCYRQFLLDSQEPEEREYPDATDQIREALIHEYYLSQKDIEICIAYDLTSLSTEANYREMEVLHDTLRSKYSLLADAAA